MNSPPASIPSYSGRTLPRCMYRQESPYILGRGANPRKLGAHGDHFNRLSRYLQIHGGITRTLNLRAHVQNLKFFVGEVGFEPTYSLRLPPMEGFINHSRGVRQPLPTTHQQKIQSGAFIRCMAFTGTFFQSHRRTQPKLGATMLCYYYPDDIVCLGAISPSI